MVSSPPSCKKPLPTPSCKKPLPTPSCNKPLPSPPIAQIINPASPPKAQRTLVDAEAGSPTSEKWPILQPENISLLESPTLPRDIGRPQRSVSEGLVLGRTAIPTLQGRVFKPVSVQGYPSSQMSGSSVMDAEPDHNESVPREETLTLNSTDPDAKTFHALSTDTKVAMTSSLEPKQEISLSVVIPPRTSSKRNSLPPSCIATDELPTRTSSLSFRPVKPVSTKWPFLSADVIDRTTDIHINGEHVDKEAKTEDGGPVTMDSANLEDSHYGSIDTTSTWSLAAGSSLNDEPEVCYEDHVRVKRLSWHSCNSETGPTLRTSADADAVLIGRISSIPAVPTMLDQAPGVVAQDCVLDSMARLAPKQVPVESTSSTSLQAPTSSSTETSESKPVKISPIRSMQPSRKSSTVDLSRDTASAGAPTPSDVQRKQEEPRSFFEAEKEALPVCHRSDTIHQFPKTGMRVGDVGCPCD
jgi:hypothetical protein